MARGNRIARLDGTAHGRNRGGVFLAITLSIGARECGFTQHVEGIAIVALLFASCPRQCAFDVATHDELMPENAHRLLERGARHRLAQFPDQFRIPGTCLADFVAIK